MTSTVHLLRRAAGRLVTSAAILAIIAYLTAFGLTLAERGRKGQPSEPLDAALGAAQHAVAWVFQHPPTYYWHRQYTPAPGLAWSSFSHSAGLLLVALAIAALLGVLLGVLAATGRRRGGSTLVVLLSVLGVSTPSFLLAMLLWVAALQISRNTGLPALPATGYGWDLHAVLPALVLAARPLAQIVQVTYVSLSQVLADDYIRTARGKGLSEGWVLLQHAFRNIRIPVLTTLGTSLRFSLASLPVVESFFGWPGLGLTLLQAIEAGMVDLVMDLTVALGLLFLLINSLLDILYPLLDPRLRNSETHEQTEERAPLGAQLALLAGWLLSLLRRFGSGGRRSAADTAPMPGLSGQGAQASAPTGSGDLPARPASRPSRALVRTLGNAGLLSGTLLVLALVALALFGERLAAANAYQTHSIVNIGGKISAPPFPPSTQFPWGSDQVGRDIQALVLSGARRTLVLALSAAAARVLLGTLLGGLAAWWRGGSLDRLVTGGVAVWAAFPATIFAMIVIQALGIQQGMWVFVVALCVVGWGEVAQFVRGQVLAVKPLPYVESARAAGARSDQVLLRHVLPNVMPALIVLAVLETGGVLMLLAELGFLNIFMGGGFRAEITAGARGPGMIFYYSDVPEWGALLSNIRSWWRSYPWLAWYPGLFFFLAILAFNTWGEGLRRFLAETRFNVNRLFNRYAVFAGLALAVGLGYALQASGPLGLYRAQAREFDAGRAMVDVEVLAGPQFAGRETGVDGAAQAAQYIADRMEQVGLFRGGESNTYLQEYSCPRMHLSAEPGLSVSEGAGSTRLTYRQDFVELEASVRSYGQAKGQVVGVALGPHPGTAGLDPYSLVKLNLRDKILLMRDNAAWYPSGNAAAGALVITSDPERLRQRVIFRPEQVVVRVSSARYIPIMYVSERVAERLLAASGSSLAQFDQAIAGLPAGGVQTTRPGPTVEMSLPVTGQDDSRSDEKCYNVIGYIPGTGALQGRGPGRGLDNQVIMVSAYYDGSGRDPDGTIYPGANDNASGVAAMLETARVLKEGHYAPAKTVVFVAWSEGERGKSLIVDDIMNAKVGFNTLSPEAVIELSGLGAGRGSGLALGQGSSYRLVQLFQRAAARVGVATTTRGRDPHFALPAPAPFGTRSALTLYASWDGSDALAHTPQDNIQSIDRRKLQQAGQAVLLGVTVLAREANY